MKGRAKLGNGRIERLVLHRRHQQAFSVMYSVRSIIRKVPITGALRYVSHKAIRHWRFDFDAPEMVQLFFSALKYIVYTDHFIWRAEGRQSVTS